MDDTFRVEGEGESGEMQTVILYENLEATEV